jgi:hypothetical protein
MTEHHQHVACRVAACLEPLGDGKEWSIYLLNDSAVTFDRVVLQTFGHEWGDAGPAVHPNVEFGDVRPGTAVLLWRDNDDEVRMWLTLAIRVGDRAMRLLTEFPMLYRRKQSLPLVEGLGKCGWVGRTEIQTV